MGRRAYELLGAESFKSCGIFECHSGCRHGVTEAFFAENGTADLVGSISILCGDEVDMFGLHQCAHGVGHGLMAWYDYGIYDALEACDLIDQLFHQDSCYSGVFMENIVGGIIRNNVEDADNVFHYTKFLNDDPHYPCNAIAEKYQFQCYWGQTDRVVQLFGSVDSIVDFCSEVHESLHYPCFHSMGRTVSAFFSRDPGKSFELCSTVSDSVNRDFCLEGALSDLF